MKLCPVNDKLALEDQSCMNKYPLYLANSESTKFWIPENSKKKDKMLPELAKLIDLRNQLRTHDNNKHRELQQTCEECDLQMNIEQCRRGCIL